nr:FAD-dependent monooxygenase [Streptomyces sp. MBT84]
MHHQPKPKNQSNLTESYYNLAWKLAMVVRGEAGPGLLDTYSAERAPVGRQIVERANLSRDQFGPIFQALGVAETCTEETLKKGVEAIRATTLEGAGLRRELKEAVQLKNYEFNAHGVEMNQRYTSDAVIPDGSPDEVFEHDAELFHQPTTRPGAKLPHAWLVDRDGRRISTLDVVGKGVFTLITGLSGSVWAEAADACAKSLGIGLDAVRIGDEGARDAYGEWSRVSGVPEDGALLVRPDGHIAWRARAGAASSEAALEELLDALRSVLDR